MKLSEFEGIEFKNFKLSILSISNDYKKLLKNLLRNLGDYYESNIIFLWSSV